MLKYLNTEIAHLEFPDEITLAINITNCPNHCKGCHSPHLWEDTGFILDTEELDIILKPHLDKITCVGFMGGDNDTKALIELAKYVREKYPKLKIGWYSGKEIFPLFHGVFHYIKLGPWKAECGPLTSKTTNQRYYINVDPDSKNYLNASFCDITEKAFREPKPWEPDYFDYIENNKKQNNDTYFDSRETIKNILDEK